MSERCKPCEAQISRLKGKPFFETIGREGVLELAHTLHRYGHDRAEIVIDEALVRRFGTDGEDRVPSASDLWALCKTNPEDFESRKKPVSTQTLASRRTEPECERCSGTGFEIVQGTYGSGARRCRSGCGVPAREVA